MMMMMMTMITTMMLKGKYIIVDFNAKLFLFRGRVNVAEKLLTLRFPFFKGIQAETFTGKYHF